METNRCIRAPRKHSKVGIVILSGGALVLRAGVERICGLPAAEDSRERTARLKGAHPHDYLL